MPLFERYLTLWLFLCIVAGIVLGQLPPGLFGAISDMEVAKVNLPVALLILLMIVPLLVKIDSSSLGQVAKHWRGTCHRRWRAHRSPGDAVGRKDRERQQGLV